MSSARCCRLHRRSPICEPPIPVPSPAPGRRRTTRPTIQGDGRLMIVAADHPARGALAVGNRPTAMNSRTDLLDRLRAALADPGVDGVLATSDILDDLLLLGAFEDKVVFSSFNRGGLAGACFEFDDQMTGATADVDRGRADERRKDAVPHRPRRSGHGHHHGGLREGRRRARSAWADRHARTVHVESGRRQGPQRPEPRRGDQVGAHRPGPRVYVGIHLDEASRGSRNGQGNGVHHAAHAAARRRSARPRRGVRQLGEGAGSAVGPWVDRRPHPAVSGRRRCQRPRWRPPCRW